MARTVDIENTIVATAAELLATTWSSNRRQVTSVPTSKTSLQRFPTRHENGAVDLPVDDVQAS